LKDHNKMKQTILNELKSLSAYDNQLSANFFCNSLAHYKLTPRELRIIINELIDEHPNLIICSTDKGYYIATTEQEAEHGINWIKSMEDKLKDRRQKIQRAVEKSITKKNPEELNLFNQ